MAFAELKVVLFWVFFSTIRVMDVQGQRDGAGHYIVPFKQTEIQWSMSEKWPKQIVIYHEETNSALIIDATTQRIAFETVNSQKIIMDTQNDKMYRTISNPKKNREEFENWLLDYNISYKLDQEPFIKCPRACEIQMKDHLAGIWDGLIKIINAQPGVFWKGIKIALGPILKCLNSFGDLFLLREPVWETYDLGVNGLLVVFEWMGKLCDQIVGGTEALVKNGVKFAVRDVIEANDGAQALYTVLKPLSKKFNLMVTLKDVLTKPELLTQFIAGLGEMVVGGVNGIFLIMSNMLQFCAKDIYGSVASLTRMVLDYFEQIKPTKKDAEDACDPLLQISMEQKEKYGNSEELKKFEQLISTLKGNGNERIISNVVNILTERKQTAKNGLMKLLQELSPTAEMTLTLPTLLIHLVKLLNTADGAHYILALFPSMLEVPKVQGQDAALQEKRVLENIRAPDLLKEMPIIKDIYKEIDESARMYTNTTLESLLSVYPIPDFIEYTTIEANDE